MDAMERINKNPIDGRFTKHAEPNLCTIKGCDRNVFGHGMCSMHYQRNVRYGSPHFRLKNANGEGATRKDGYRQITVNDVLMLEHRYVMESILGRKLTFHEHVHHIDGNKLNNSPENLQLMSSSDHGRHHHPKGISRSSKSSRD